MRSSGSIFILLSIKTRIETASIFLPDSTNPLFLSYYPLKQGLKPGDPYCGLESGENFYPTIH